MFYRFKNHYKYLIQLPSLKICDFLEHRKNCYYFIILYWQQVHYLWVGRVCFQILVSFLQSKIFLVSDHLPFHSFDKTIKIFHRSYPHSQTKKARREKQKQIIFFIFLSTVACHFFLFPPFSISVCLSEMYNRIILPSIRREHNSSFSHSFCTFCFSFQFHFNSKVKLEFERWINILPSI